MIRVPLLGLGYFIREPGHKKGGGGGGGKRYHPGYQEYNYVYNNIIMCIYIYIYGWLSIFLLPGMADAEKFMVPPDAEKENEGLERWL